MGMKRKAWRLHDYPSGQAIATAWWDWRFMSAWLRFMDDQIPTVGRGLLAGYDDVVDPESFPMNQRKIESNL